MLKNSKVSSENNFIWYKLVFRRNCPFVESIFFICKLCGSVTVRSFPHLLQSDCICPYVDVNICSNWYCHFSWVDSYWKKREEHSAARLSHSRVFKMNRKEIRPEVPVQRRWHTPPHNECAQRDWTSTRHPKLHSQGNLIADTKMPEGVTEDADPL